MPDRVRVMIEIGKKKRSVAVAFDWPGWDRSGKTEGQALEVLEAYRARYAPVAERAGLGDSFATAGELEVVERKPGIGMTDFYGLSMVSAASEQEPMTHAELERKIALMRAAWATFDDTAARVSAELRKGPRGGGRERDHIVRHVNGAEIVEFAPKVEVRFPLETRDDPAQVAEYREALVAAIRDYNARGATARNWTIPFLIRHTAWHMLDHAWELEDRDLSGVAGGAA
ncbi:MAG TPA: hypothetical protein VFI34_09985 [Candidatus Limnocylindrales bacterium]|nr:hypothetical protein [Candidatus Limnocylindrales bacterium]